MSTLRTILPLTTALYERYLPTAFDDSLTMLQKTNKTIHGLNDVIALLNEMGEHIDSSNALQDENLNALQLAFDELKLWIESEGISLEVNELLTTWFNNGQLATLINNGILATKADSSIVGINPEKYGLNEGSTNNRQAFADALTSGNKKIVFPYQKTFKFTESLGTYSLSDVEIDLNGCTLDFSGAPITNTDSAILFQGSVGESKLLTADALEGSNLINCDTSSFQVGSMVKIYSSKIWDSTRTSTRCGEIVFVESIVNSGQMRVTTPLNDSYLLANSASVHLITPVKNIRIHNGKLIGPTGNSEMRGVRVSKGLDCLIEDLTITGFDVNQIQLTDVIRGTVKDCRLNSAGHAAMGYGVSFADASQDCIATNNHFTDVRHSLSTNNNVTTSWGITRRILFTENTVVDSAPAIGGIGGDAIDTHGGAEEIYILNNEVFSSSGLGINIEARSAIVRGNRIKGTGSVGIYFNPYADGKESRVLISDNVLTPIGDGVNSDYGIQVQARVADVAETIVSNNIIESQNSAIRLITSGAFKHKKAVVSGNAILVTEVGFGIDVDNSDFVVIQGNSVEAPNYPIEIGGVKNSTITGNTLKINGINASRRFGVRVMDSSSRNIISGNTVKNVGSVVAGSYGIEINDTGTYNSVQGNVCSEGFDGAVTLGIGVGNIQANNL
jgi:Right handed beta helix region